VCVEIEGHHVTVGCPCVCAYAHECCVHVCKYASAGLVYSHMCAYGTVLPIDSQRYILDTQLHAKSKCSCARICAASHSLLSLMFFHSRFLNL